MTSQEIEPALTACLQELHLPTMRSQFQAAAQQAQQETLSYENYLLELAELANASSGVRTGSSVC